MCFSYLSKFTEFLRLFVSIHLRRFENSSHFPVLELLTLLFKYTFKQVKILTYRHVATCKKHLSRLINKPSQLFWTVHF